MCRKPGKRVLDVGACYGVHTLPLLANGAEVVANDLDASHLQGLSAQVPEAYRDQVTCHHGRFPHDFQAFPDGHFDAIMIAHVLHFLSLPDLFTALSVIKRLLRTNGQLFVLTFSPFTYRTRDFVRIYAQRKAMGDGFPGYIEDADRFGLRPDNLPMIQPLIHYMDLQTVQWLFRSAGFTIEQASYVELPETCSPQQKQLYTLDGREWVGLIASIS